MLDFVNVEQEEARLILSGTDLLNPDFSRVAEALGGIHIEESGDLPAGVFAKGICHRERSPADTPDRGRLTPGFDRESGTAQACHQ